MADWSTEWTGEFPNLCRGEWILYKGGKEVDTDIPFQEGNANTFGTYESFHFDDNWSEEWETYESGLDKDDWIDENIEWLRTLSADEQDWEDIFYAFQENDWRHQSCGGCI